MRYVVSPRGVAATAAQAAQAKATSTKAASAKATKAKTAPTSYASQKFPRSIIENPLFGKCSKYLCPLQAVVPRRFIPSILLHPPVSPDTLVPQSPPPAISDVDHTASLPDELLLQVFRHVEPSELVRAAQHVNARWSRVAHDDSLWRDYEYAPPRGTPTRLMTSVLRQSPRLRAFSLPPGADANAVLDALSNRCRELHSLNVEVAARLNVRVLKSLFTRIPALRHLQLSQRPRSPQGVYKRLALGFRPPSDEHSPMSYFYESLNSPVYRSQTYMFVAKYVLRVRKNDIDTLSINFVSDEMLELIQQCSGLEMLRLEFDQYQEDLENNLQFITEFSKLQSLEIVNFHNDEVLNELFSKRSWTALKELNLSWCSELSDRTCRTIQEKCPNLKKIVLDCCLKVTDKGIQHLSKISTLKHVKMSSCPLLTAESVRLVTHSKKVEGLDLTNFFCPVADYLLHLVSNKQLRCLSLVDCIITQNDISALMTNLKRTKILMNPIKVNETLDQNS